MFYKKINPKIKFINDYYYLFAIVLKKIKEMQTVAYKILYIIQSFKYVKTKSNINLHRQA